MLHYFAPLEGITDSIYRQIHHKYFPGVDRYYTPFFSPTVHRTLTQKERRELQQAESLPHMLVPQVLTRNAEDFLWMAKQCADAGYREINLNLGCPSGTVTAKGKGAGMLRDTASLVQFLDEVFAASPISISVKTRIGYASPDEFPALLDIFNQYPIRELTIHPRTRTAFYGGNVDFGTFEYAAENSKNPLCYNGNLCSLSQISAFQEKFPSVGAVMLGRGLIADPGMLTPGGTQVQPLAAFHDELLAVYTNVFGSSRNAMFRMKENLHYLICRFDGGDKLYKRLRKTTDINEYKDLMHTLFATVPLAKELHSNW